MRRSRIKDIGRVVSGSTPKTGIHNYWGGHIPWVTPKELSSLRGQYLNDSLEKITEEGYKSCSTTMLPTNSVLFSSRAPIGLVAINKIPVCTNQGFKSIIPNKDVSSLYLYYTLKFFAKRLDSMGNGATFRELSKKTFEEFEIPLPELEKQTHIANILSKAESLISKRKESIRLLDEFLKSTFLDMFGDPETNDNGFPISQLEDLCTEVVDCPHSTPNKADSVTNFPCIRTSELTDGYISWDSMQYLEENEYIKRTQRLVPVEGDLVYGREGTYGDAIRIPAGYKFSLGQRTMLLRPDSRKCNGIFLWAMVRSDYVYRQAKKKNSGSTVGHVNVKDIRKFSLLNPPMKLQTKFAQIVEKTEALKAHYQASLQELENLYGALSQRAFRGELQ